MELSDKGKAALGIMNDLDNYLSISPDSFSRLSTLGKSKPAVLDSLHTRLQPDLIYSSGKILGAMTTDPHEFARFVFEKYMERNLGDSGLVVGTRDVEREVVQMMGSLLGAPDVHGNMVSGGTEANLMAMYLAKKSRPEIITPEVIIPESAHYSFDKASELMGLKLKRARLTTDYQLDLDHYKSLITENTIAMVGVAGTTALGLIDPIRELGTIARKNDLFYHVDGAFGGLILPWLRELGHDLPEFDMSTPEIITYTVDPHKFGMGVNPSGGLLVREERLQKHGFEIPYLAGGGFKSYNLMGTRPGASAISFWALMHHLGREGFRAIASRCWNNTQYLKEEIQSIPGLKIAIEPQAPVLGLQLTPQAGLTLDQLDKKMRSRGWALGIFRQWDLARIVMMPHIRREHLDAFLTEIKQILA